MKDTTIGFSQEFYSDNRRRLRELYADTSAPIVLTANGQLQRNGDNAFRFRQDSNFWYLTGVDHPDVALVMDGDDEYLIVPERDVIRETFDGSIDPEALKRSSGVAEVLVDEDGWKRLGKRLKSSKRAGVLAPSPGYIEWYGLYSNPARARLEAKIKSYNSKIEFIDLRDEMMQLRVIKKPTEIAAIQHAIDVTIDGLQYVTDKHRLAGYEHEYEVEGDLTARFRRRNCGHSFDPIVAGGMRACQMHNTDNIGDLNRNELLLFDVGAEYKLYAADISRTISLNGNPSERQQAVHAAVCAAQDYAYTLLKPGTVNQEYEKQMEAFMGEKLRELGVIEGSTSEEIRKYFPHMVSHFLGLDAHDVGDYSKPMRPGMVLVCEPGIYIPEEGIGVRIEDCVLITETGCEVLSRALSRDITA